jgi:UDP-N-acetylglucosamine:LPS N-acetylglucosamine transferase
VARTELTFAGGSREDRQIDVLLVASPGGHLLQLLALRGAWRGFSTAWVTLDRADARSLLEHERVYFARGPTNRSFNNLLRNLVVAQRLVRRLRPRVVITTGAGVAVPFAWLAHLTGARVVYVESLSRIDHASMSLRLISPVADRVYGQWPEFAEAVRGARFAGSVFAP